MRNIARNTILTVILSCIQNKKINIYLFLYLQLCARTTYKNGLNIYWVRFLFQSDIEINTYFTLPGIYLGLSFNYNNY